MVCSDFAVIRRIILRNYLLRKTKKYLWTYLQDFINPLFKPPHTEKMFLQTTSASDWTSYKRPDKTTLE